MQIAVVGAGIAGLAAARALVERKHDVTVFERSQVVGGRVGTKVISAIELPRGLSGELAFDHGAQYFTVRDQRLSELAAEWERDRVIARWTGRIVVFDGEGWEEVSPSAEATADKDSVKRYVGIPGMRAIPEALAAGLNIRFGLRIDAPQSLLQDFDRVIVATPPVSTTLVSMKPCWAVMAAFEEPVAARFDAAFVTGSAVSWVARNSSKPKRNRQIDTWVIHASPTWSDAHRDDQADDVGAFLMEAFEDLIPAGLPRAFYATVHRWRQASADPPLAVGAIQDPDSKIILCGDWCKGPRIEDAFVSGLEAAALTA